MEVRVGKQRVVIDAGTGIIDLGRALVAEGAVETEILLSHLHHDHVMGLPFFAPLLMPAGRLTLYCGNLDGQDASVPLDAMFGPPLFPIGLGDLPGSIRHVGFRAGEDVTLSSGRIAVRTHLLDHPSGATGYRFDNGGASLCYISDVEHRPEGPEPGLVDFVRGADLVIYDAMFTEDQYCRCVGWGHSTWQAGVSLCQQAGGARLAAFHHHPQHDDATLDRLQRSLDAALPGSFFAREGQEVEVRATAPVLVAR